jgi:ABC-type multidrug transport system permease subunit
MNRNFDKSQLLQLISAHFKELIREPGVLFWGIVFPILMSLGLGVAFTQKADVIRKIAIINSPVNGVALLAKLDSLFAALASEKPVISRDSFNCSITIPDKQLGNTTFLFRKTGWEDALLMLKRGKVNLILAEKDGKTEYHFDPLNPDAQLSYIKLSALLGSSEFHPTSDQATIKPLTLTGTRYIDFLVPGLIAMGVMMSSMWGISYGIIDRRSKKLLRRMVATPMKKSYFLLSLITVRFGMNFIESGLLVLFAWLVFNISIQGNVAALLAIFMAGNFAFAGIAIFTSSYTANTEVGNGLINVVVMPMMVLSGVFFSYHNFPDWSIPVIQKLPLTMLADAIRSIFNEGAGAGDIYLPFVILTAIGILFFSLGLKLFRWH